MENITGVIIREHIEQECRQKFPRIVPWSLLCLGMAMLITYYVLLLQDTITIMGAIIVLGVGMIATICSFITLPSHIREEYLIEVTPRMSAIDWLALETNFKITNEGVLLYRCTRKGWKVERKEEQYVE